MVGSFFRQTRFVFGFVFFLGLLSFNVCASLDDSLVMDLDLTKQVGSYTVSSDGIVGADGVVTVNDDYVRSLVVFDGDRELEFEFMTTDFSKIRRVVTTNWQAGGWFTTHYLPDGKFNFCYRDNTNTQYCSYLGNISSGQFHKFYISYKNHSLFVKFDDVEVFRNDSVALPKFDNNGVYFGAQQNDVRFHGKIRNPKIVVDGEVVFNDFVHKDLSGNGNHGLPKNGQSGSSFDGVDDYIVTLLDEYSIPSSFTIFAEVIPKELNRDQFILGTTKGSHDDSPWIRFESDNDLRVSVRGENLNQVYVDDEKVQIGVRENIIFSYANNIFNYYRNGELIYTDDRSIGTRGDWQKLNLGCFLDNGNCGNFANITLERFKVFNKALSQEEVFELVNGNSCPLTDGQVLTESISFPVGTVCDLPNGIIIGSDSVEIDCNGADFDFGSIFLNGTNNVRIVDCKNVKPVTGDYTYNFTVWNSSIEGGDFGGCVGCSVGGGSWINPLVEWVAGNGTSFNVGSFIGNIIDYVKPDTKINLVPSVDYNLSFNFSDDVFDGAENITLNCNGGGLVGSNIPGSVGIYSTSDKKITINNCTISNYGYNVFLKNFNSGVFTNNVLKNALSVDMVVSDSSFANVRNNEFLSFSNVSNVSSFMLSGSNNTVLENVFYGVDNVWDRDDNVYCLNGTTNVYVNDLTGPTCAYVRPSCDVIEFNSSLVCDGVVEVSSQVELDDYLVDDYLSKDLVVKFDVSSDLEVHTPCRVVFDSGLSLKNGFTCVDAKSGIVIEKENDFELLDLFLFSDGAISIDKNFVSSGSNVNVSASVVEVDKLSEFDFEREIDLVSDSFLAERGTLFDAGNISLSSDLVAISYGAKFEAEGSFNLVSKVFEMN